MFSCFVLRNRPRNHAHLLDLAERIWEKQIAALHQIIWPTLWENKFSLCVIATKTTITRVLGNQWFRSHRARWARRQTCCWDFCLCTITHPRGRTTHRLKYMRISKYSWPQCSSKTHFWHTRPDNSMGLLGNRKLSIKIRNSRTKSVLSCRE